MDTKKPKILLCEDDPNLGSVLKNYLELNDYDVTLERDGRLGLAAFQREKFELCLLDVMMPNMDGFTLAEEIRDVDPDIPLFFLSAKTMKEDVIQGYKLGADDYITKPFDSEVLLLKIKAILKRNEEQNKESENKEFDLSTYHFNPKLRQLIHIGHHHIQQTEFKFFPLKSSQSETAIPFQGHIIIIQFKNRLKQRGFNKKLNPCI